MLIEGRAVSLTQLSELHEVSDSNPLHYDGTTKKGKKYGSFQLSTSAGKYTLSVNDLVSGSAEHTLDLLKQDVSEISEAENRSLKAEKCGEKIINSIKHTLTDRASTNTNFNAMLESYRETLLSTAVECWVEMDEMTKKSMAKINNRFCGLHMLVNLAELCNAVLKEFEQTKTPVMSEYCSFAERNRLLDAVAADLNGIHLLTGCGALGIVGKIVTAPLWCFLVSDAPFSDVAGVHQSLTQSSGAWAGDASDLLDGCACPFPGAKLHKDSVVCDALLTPCEKDAKTRQLLQLLCTAFHAYMARAWSAYLDGGEHLTTTGSLPKTNILSEHDFWPAR